MAAHAFPMVSEVIEEDLPVADQLRATMSRFASGVTVVTVADNQRQLHGMTISSFCSVSLDPPMVLVCLSDSSRTLQVMQEQERFAIHVLGDGQPDLARHFAVRGGNRNSGVTWSMNERGQAVLDRFHALVECRLTSLQRAGDHLIALGLVERAEASGAENKPLLYYGSAMHRFPIAN